MVSRGLIETHINVSLLVATALGFEVTAKVALVSVEGIISNPSVRCYVVRCTMTMTCGSSVYNLSLNGQLPPFDTTGKLPLERPLNFDGIENLAGQAAHSRLMGNI